MSNRAKHTSKFFRGFAYTPEDEFFANTYERQHGVPLASFALPREHGSFWIEAIPSYMAEMEYVATYKKLTDLQKRFLICSYAIFEEFSNSISNMNPTGVAKIDVVGHEVFVVMFGLRKMTDGLSVVLDECGDEEPVVRRSVLENKGVLESYSKVIEVQTAFSKYPGMYACLLTRYLNANAVELDAQFKNERFSFSKQVNRKILDRKVYEIHIHLDDIALWASLCQYINRNSKEMLANPSKLNVLGAQITAATHRFSEGLLGSLQERDNREDTVRIPCGLVEIWMILAMLDTVMGSFVDFCSFANLNPKAEVIEEDPYVNLYYYRDTIGKDTGYNADNSRFVDAINLHCFIEYGSKRPAGVRARQS